MERLALMPKYEAYKDSGVEWLGDIPSSWELKPGFVAFCESKSNNKGMKENTVLSLSYGNIVVKPEEKLVGLVPESFETYQLVEPDDIIVRCTDLQNDKVSLRTGLAKNKGIITSAYLNLRAKSGFDARFLHYYLYSLDTTKVLYKFGSGLRQNLSFLDFKRLPIFEIPEDTQKLISNYLDKKTAQIDDAIAIKEQQISLLKERKQIIIQQAVTQGLDPNVPMKDSGVDWIGDIPAHWNLMSLRYAFEFLNSRRVPISAVERESRQGVYPYYGASGVIDYVDDYIFDEDLILIAEDGANLLSKSTPLAFVATGKYWVNNHAHIIKPKFHGFKYWAELLSGLDYTVFISGAAQPKLTRDRLASVLVPVPPKDEIQEIILFIEGIEPDLNHTIDIQKSQIEKLKEYKTTLINSAVTGKIKITPEMVEQ
ncbi:restriction endonuclease subunit S [Proteus mirabilis]|uniref:restriction endonuclease subunit S n=1 Tax=Providencia TaxID=586 RepID=UPI0012387EE7|nr:MULTISPECIES: restriction endonuclease subunit S [Providencia]ELZ9638955.1 restriction endonuclease subunit S [Proteus mirabilis]MDK7744917.1 restriction endonuclease subunit S [Providencia rettgeri]MDK7758789.1 restriction endonuclease subunit S [Providencia rettgeri]QET97018.1 restriction endonuclease subunit S [Providencia stuartii]HEM8145236.1 restriction endonuclease subunit S [Providencia stuartii]